MATQTTNSTSTEANVDPIDQIADLLIDDIGVEDTEESTDQTEESTATVTDEEASEEETETTDEETTEEEETTDEDETEETWGSALDLNDDSISLDDDGNFKGVITKVDGVTETVSLKDLVSGFQNNKFNTHKSQSLSEEKKLFDEEKIQLTSEYNQRLDSVTSLADYLSKKITGNYEEIDWQQLRIEDPAEYAAKRQDFASQAQELQQLQGALNSERTAQQEEMGKKGLELRQTYLKDEFEKVLVNNPTWRDETVFNSTMTEMKTFLSDSYGFNDNDFATVADSRLFELMKDAKSYRDGKLSTDKKTKNKKVPKFQKSTKRRVAKKTTKLDTLTKRAKASSGDNRRIAETDAVAELLTGG